MTLKEIYQGIASLEKQKKSPWKTGDTKQSIDKKIEALKKKIKQPQR